MAQKISMNVKTLVAKANADIKTISVEEAFKILGTDDHVFVDLRDIREIKRSGKIPGAFPAQGVCLNFGLIQKARTTKIYLIRKKHTYFTVQQDGDPH